MAEKVTLMILKVDLQCPCCYKKVKKILCKFPQIRDQVYEEKQNLVKITVICCSPEKIRDKLCCMGGKVIKSIEIVAEPKPKTKPKPKSEPKLPDKPPPGAPLSRPLDDKPDDSDEPPIANPPKKVETRPAQPSPKAPESAPVIPHCCGPWSEGHGGGPCHCGHGRPSGFCCDPCSEGHGGGPCDYGYGRPSGFRCGPCSECLGGGPCHYGYGRPVPPPPCYDNYGYGYGYGKGCYVNRCNYFSEEHTGSCTIM